MISARLPQGVVAPHAVIARQRVHDGLVKSMTHVQRAGDIWRRQQNAKVVLFSTIQASGEIAARFPNRIPVTFDFGRFKTFGEFHKA